MLFELAWGILLKKLVVVSISNSYSKMIKSNWYLPFGVTAAIQAGVADGRSWLQQTEERQYQDALHFGSVGKYRYTNEIKKYIRFVVDTKFHHIFFQTPSVGLVV